MGTPSAPPAKSPSNASVPPFELHEDGNGISINDWSIRSVQHCIASSDARCELANRLSISLPAMLFDNALLEAKYRTHSHSTTAHSTPHMPQSLFSIQFNAADALRLVGPADPSVQVRAAEHWRSKKSRSDVHLTVIEKVSDWTFSTSYSGTIQTNTSPQPVPSPNLQTSNTEAPVAQIDYNALRNTDLPILFMSEVVLFEDELDDNGTASYKVRLRVMPSFFFILARFFLRVDHVLVRVYDTRYYHKFGTNVIVKESVSRQSKFSSSEPNNNRSPFLQGPNIDIGNIPICSTTVDNLHLPS